MRTLFIFALVITVFAFAGHFLDFVHNHISWKEAWPGIFLSTLAGLVLLYIYRTVRKKGTAHR